MSILNVNKINPVGGGSTITIAGIASVTNNISVGNSVTAGSFVGPIEGNVTGNVTGNADTASGLSGNPSINTTGIVTATSFVPTVGQLSHRNIIINGAMNIAQRATQSNSGGGYNTVDRIDIRVSGADETPTQEQADVASGTSPYAEGFRKSYKITNGNQTSGAGTGDYFFIFYQVEAQDIVQSGWNYVSPTSFITLSFWVKSSVAQNFYGYIRSRETTEQSHAFDTGSLSANTWTKVVRTFSGNSNIVMANDNGQGLGIYLAPFFGTDYTDNSKGTSAWSAYTNPNRTPDSTSTWWTTNDATFEITGLQLEVGPVATPFEHRSFADEFRRCQRYYQQYTNIMSVGYVPDNTSKSYSHGFHFPVEMRAAPTLTISNTGSSGGQYVNDGQTNSSISSLNAQASQSSQIEYYFNITTDLSNFRGAYAVSATSTTYQTIYKISAEL